MAGLEVPAKPTCETCIFWNMYGNTLEKYMPCGNMEVWRRARSEDNALIVKTTKNFGCILYVEKDLR